MVKEWYVEKLYDESLYHHFIYVEIHDIEVTEVNVISKTYKIVSIEEESIEIEVNVELKYSVDVVIDDEEFSYYDDEDKTTYFFETKSETIERTTNAKLSLLAFIENKDNFEDTFELLEINKDKPFEIDDEKYEYR